MQTMMIQHNGLMLSSLPTECYRQLIHVRVNDLLQQSLWEFQKLHPNSKHTFQQTLSKTHIKAYVDPSQLSYNSFENILNLDECYFGPKLGENQKLPLSIMNVQKVENYYKFSIKDHQNLLMELHKMDLYSLPFNNLSRGGKRMIFSSLILADALKNQLESSIVNFSRRYLKLCSGLNSINHVFRLNCFNPKSGNFKTHYDTPFSDNNRKLYSKYTLVIYLTGGSNEENGCLRIKNEKIKEIPALTGILFDQRYEHEGWPYVQRDKIFLRSELIYHIKNVDSNPRVAKMFNQACYFHKQSLCNPQNPLYSEQLQKYSNQLFNHTAKLRYTLAQKKRQLYSQLLQNEQRDSPQYEKILFQVEEKYLLKRNMQVMYITNGNSFWFLDGLPLKLLVKLVLVDYFNGRMGQLSGRQVKETSKMKINSKPLKINFTSDHATQDENPTQHENKVNQQILTMIDSFTFPDEEKQIHYPYTFEQIVDTGIKSYKIRTQDCIMMSHGELDRSDSYEQQAQELSLQRLYTKMAGVGVMLFNGKLYVNDGCIQIDQQKGQISFSETFLNHSINFASCQCEIYRRDQVIAKQTLQVEGFILPKITYETLKPLKGYKLSIDMFKNGFIHRINTSISRPYAINPRVQRPRNSFYDRDEEYINSDNESSEQQKNQEGQQNDRFLNADQFRNADRFLSADQFLNEMRQRRNRNIRNSINHRN